MDDNCIGLKFYTTDTLSNECVNNRNIDTTIINNENNTNTTFSLTFLISKDEKSSSSATNELQNYVCDFSLLEKYLSADDTESNESQHNTVQLYNQMKAKCDATTTTTAASHKNENLKELKKRFICEFCQRAFKKKCNLIAHKRIHTGERPFQCTMCDKTFTESSSVFKHQRVHTGERPYKCDICDHRFKQICNLKRHRNEHFYRVYECEMCKKSFVRENHLNHHRIITHALNHSDDFENIHQERNDTDFEN